MSFNRQRQVVEHLQNISIALGNLYNEILFQRQRRDKEANGHATVYATEEARDAAMRRGEPLGIKGTPGPCGGPIGIINESSIRAELAQERKKNESFNNLVECEVCGCLLKKETARKGETEIRVRKTSNIKECRIDNEEYIYHPYYCNKCDDEPVETGCDTFYSPSIDDMLANITVGPMTACSSIADSPDAQLKRAQKDFFLGQAELLRQQAEAQRIKNRIDEKTWFPKKEGK